MNVYVILFCILCNFIISGQSEHNSDSLSDENREVKSNSPEISDSEGLKSERDYEEQNVDENEDQIDENDNDEDNEDKSDKDDDDDAADHATNDDYAADDADAADDAADDDDNDDDDGDESKENSGLKREDLPPIPPQYQYEINFGDMADLFSTNKHKYVPFVYKDFGRRFVLKYPTNKRLLRADDEAEATLDQAIKESLKDNDASNFLIPRKAPPKVVLAIAKKAALLEASRPQNPADDVTIRDALRSGDYWNGIWKEDVVVPQKVLRTKNKSLEKYTDAMPELETIRVKIMPGSKLHDLVSLTKQISPRLLYIVNNKD